jgi:hypothetical protein
VLIWNEGWKLRQALLGGKNHAPFPTSKAEFVLLRIIRLAPVAFSAFDSEYLRHSKELFSNTQFFSESR